MPNCRRGGVELRDPVPFDDAPKGVRLRVVGGALVDERRRPQEQWRVHDVAVSRDPPDVRCAPPQVIVVDIKDVFKGGRGLNHVAACGVHDALWLPCAARGVQDIEDVFGVHGLDLTFGWFALDQGVEKHLFSAQVRHRYRIPRVFYDDRRLDGRTAADRFV